MPPVATALGSRNAPCLEPPGAAALLAVWWETIPDSFRVARDRAGSVETLLALAEIDRVPYGVARNDPVLGAWRRHLQRHPVPPGQRALGIRCLLTRAGGEALSPAQAAGWLDIKRVYLELRPALRRAYTVVQEIELYPPALERLGFEELADNAVEIGGALYHPVVLDFGPSSIDGWLARLVSAELHVDNASLLDASQRQLVLDGSRVDLSPLEFELLLYLERREGRIVERAALLRDVWGTEFAGGSNVIEAVVSSLRRKLGPRAAQIETIRGVGYRFRSPH